MGAGLRGAGHDVSDLAVAAMRVEGGAAGYVDIVARLLATTFGASESDGATEHTGGDAAGPFPGAT